MSPSIDLPRGSSHVFFINAYPLVYPNTTLFFSFFFIMVRFRIRLGHCRLALFALVLDIGYPRFAFPLCILYLTLLYFCFDHSLLALVVHVIVTMSTYHFINLVTHSLLYTVTGCFMFYFYLYLSCYFFLPLDNKPSIFRMVSPWVLSYSNLRFKRHLEMTD